MPTYTANFVRRLGSLIKRPRYRLEQAVFNNMKTLGILKPFRGGVNFKKKMTLRQSVKQVASLDKPKKMDANRSPAGEGNTTERIMSLLVIFLTHFLFAVFVAVGQAIFKRINATMKKVQVKQDRLLKRYNAMKDHPTKMNRPTVLSKTDVISLESAGFDARMNSALASAKQERAIEEVSHVKEEMKNYLRYYQQKLAHICSELTLEPAQGVKARLFLAASVIEMTLLRAESIFSKYISFQETMPTYASNLGMVPGGKPKNSHVDSAEEFEDENVDSDASDNDVEDDYDDDVMSHHYIIQLWT